MPASVGLYFDYTLNPFGQFTTRRRHRIITVFAVSGAGQTTPYAIDGHAEITGYSHYGRLGEFASREQSHPNRHARGFRGHALCHKCSWNNRRCIFGAAK
jgi:hypothetical protein